MKRFLTLALITCSIGGFSQTYLPIDKQTQLVKRECEIIVVTTDSLVATNMRNVPELLEEVSCYSSVSKSKAIMFWFRIESESAIQRGLNPYLVKVD